jgi:hypothetical protein
MAISPCRISCLKNCGKSTAPNGSCCGPIRACARRWKPSRCARLWKTSHGTDEGRHPCDFEPEAMFLFRVRSKLAVYCAQSWRAGRIGRYVPGAAGNLACVGVHPDVQLAPRPTLPDAMLLDQPFARAAQLQPGAVHQQVHGRAVSIIAGARPWYVHCFRSPAERGEGGHCQAETEKINDRADQAFGLAQSQPKYRLQCQRRQDRQGRIPGLAARGGSWYRAAACNASPLNQTVRGIWWRRAALALNGMMAISDQDRDPPKSPSQQRQFLSPCNNTTERPQSIRRPY